MNDWKQTQFGKEYDAFRQELDDYYLSLIHISEPTRP